MGFDGCGEPLTLRAATGEQPVLRVAVALHVAVSRRPVHGVAGEQRIAFALRLEVGAVDAQDFTHAAPFFGSCPGLGTNRISAGSAAFSSGISDTVPTRPKYLR